MRYLVLILLLSSCGVHKRVERIIKKNPEVLERIVREATVITEYDTLTVIQDNGRIDTIYKEIEVPIVQIIEEKTRADKRRDRKTWKLDYQREKAEVKKLKEEIKLLKTKQKLNKSEARENKAEARAIEKENRPKILKFIGDYWHIPIILLFLLFLVILFRKFIKWKPKN